MTIAEPDHRGARVRGVGLGLRWELVDQLLAEAPPLGFVEVSPENYVGRGGYFDATLERAASTWPIVTHGLTMNLGGHDPLDGAYLEAVRAFCERVGSPWHSDHLCFSSSGDIAVHELLPVSFKESEVTRIADRVRRAQDALGLPLAIENVSFYLHPGRREMSEAEFLARVCEAADCGLLLDVNNAYVNATNFGYDVDAWLAALPLERVVQIHVAGHDWFAEEGAEWELLGARPADAAARERALIVDTHGSAVADEVLSLLERTLARTGPVPVLLERDQSFPELGVLLAEVRALEAIVARASRISRPA